jgi:hypothetical protein
MPPIEAPIVEVPRPGGPFGAKRVRAARRSWAVGFVLAAALLAGCGSDSATPAPTPAATTSAPDIKPTETATATATPVKLPKPDKATAKYLAGMRKACADSSALDAPNANGLVLPLSSDTRDHNLLLATAASRGTFKAADGFKALKPPPAFAPTQRAMLRVLGRITDMWDRWLAAIKTDDNDAFNHASDALKGMDADLKALRDAPALVRARLSAACPAAG